MVHSLFHRRNSGESKNYNDEDEDSGVREPFTIFAVVVDQARGGRGGNPSGNWGWVSNENTGLLLYFFFGSGTVGKLGINTTHKQLPHSIEVSVPPSCVSLIKSLFNSIPFRIF